MRIRFTKMCASGNDFVVIDNRAGTVPGDRAEFARIVCRRRLSVGADGLLLLERASGDGNFRMRIFNPDGSEAEMCGNGCRAIARFANKVGAAPLKMRFETIAGMISAEVAGDNVRLGMVEPRGFELNIPLDVEGKRYEAHFVDTGVPHTVIFVPDLDAVDVVGLGRRVRHDRRFQPAGTNVDFARAGMGQNEILIRTYERGVEDETLACGTGAVAAAVVSCKLGKASPPVSVLARSGNRLTVHFRTQDDRITAVGLEGDAGIVYEGELVWRD